MLGGGKSAHEGHIRGGKGDQREGMGGFWWLLDRDQLPVAIEKRVHVKAKISI